MKCHRHNREYELFGGVCPDCSIEKELKEQSRIAKEQLEANERLAKEQLRALEEDAARREELHYEAIAEQQRLAEEAIFEQQRIAEENLRQQRNNIANAWRLQSEAKANNALAMFNAGMFEEALAQAKEAIGEIGTSGDPSNIRGQKIAAMSLMALNKSVDATKYFSSQIKLLYTPLYQNHVTTHLEVLNSLPQDENLLQSFSAAMRQNAVNWEDPNSFLELIHWLGIRNLNSDAEYMAQLCVAKLENCYIAKTHTAVIVHLSGNDFENEKIKAANITVKNSPQMVGRYFSGLDETLDTMINTDLLTQAKQLSEVMLSHSDKFYLQVKRQEILYQSKIPFDNQLSEHLKKVSYQSRNELYSQLVYTLQLKTILGLSYLSQPTEFFVKNQIIERYKQWIPDIKDEIKKKTLSQLGLNLKIEPNGIYAFVSSILCGFLCFPISLILNSIWGIKIYQKHQKLQNAQPIADKFIQDESNKWKEVFAITPQFGDLKFSDNSSETILFYISVAIFVILAIAQLIGIYFDA